MRNFLLTIAFSTTIFACNNTHTAKAPKADSIAVAEPAAPVPYMAPIEKQAPSAIEKIKTEVARINNGNLRSVRHDFVCDEKAYVVYHYDGKDIVKVTIDWGTVGDAYHREEFFYKDGKLIFDYDLLEGAGAYPGGDKKLERRHYVVNDKAVRYRKNQNVVPCKGCDYNASSKPYKFLNAEASGDFGKWLCNNS